MASFSRSMPPSTARSASREFGGTLPKGTDSSSDRDLLTVAVLITSPRRRPWKACSGCRHGLFDRRGSVAPRSVSSDHFDRELGADVPTKLHRQFVGSD